MGESDDPRQRLARRRRLQVHRRRARPGRTSAWRDTRHIGKVRVHPHEPRPRLRRGARPRLRAERGARRLPLDGRRQDLGAGALPQRRRPARSTSRWTRTTRASSTPPSGRRSATRTSSISGGAGQRPLQVHRRRRHLDRDHAATRACRRACSARSASPPRPRSADRVWAHRRGRGRRASSARTTAARPGSALSEERDLRQRAWYYMHIYRRPAGRRHASGCSTSSCWKSTDGGKTFDAVPTPHGDNHDLWIDPHDPQRMIEGNDGGALRHLQRRRDLVHDLQPADGAVLPRHHRQPDAVPRLRRAAGQHDDQRAEPLASTARSPSASGTSSGGGESGYIAVGPTTPNIVFARQLSAGLRSTPLRPPHRPDAQHHRLAGGHGCGAGANDAQVPLPVDLPDRALAARPERALRHRQPRLPLDRRGHELGGDQPRPDAQRPEQARVLRRADHPGQHRRRVSTARSSPSPSRRTSAGVFWAGSDDGLVHVSRDGGKTWQNVTPPDLPEWALITHHRAVAARRRRPPTSPPRATSCDDFAPYLFKTNDYGETWTKITDGIPDGRLHARHPRGPGRGAACSTPAPRRASTSRSTTARTGSALQRQPAGRADPRPGHQGHDLVVATHGRSFWILDDITPLRQLTARRGERAGAPLHAARRRSASPRRAASATRRGRGKNYNMTGAGHRSPTRQGEAAPARPTRHLPRRRQEPAGWRDRRTTTCARSRRARSR